MYCAKDCEFSETCSNADGSEKIGQTNLAAIGF